MTDACTPQPDPERMVQFCREILPEILETACQVERTEAAAIGQDVLARATAFAALPERAQDILGAPFVEEVFDHEPTTVSLELLAATAVVVRNSRIEHAHVAGLVEDGGLHAITRSAAGPLSHLLAAAKREPVALTGPDPFTDLAVTFPRAWTCLDALAAAIADGGRVEYRAPTVTDLPSLPQGDEIVPDRRSEQIEGATLFDSMDPRFNEEFMRQIHAVIDAPGDAPRIFFVSALSRFSRNPSKLLRVIELLLAHRVTVLTTNYMLRPHDVWVRRGQLVKAVTRDPWAGVRRLNGLVGSHRRAVEQLFP